MMTDSQHDADATWALLANALDPIEPPKALRDRLLSELRGPERFTCFTHEVARRFELSMDAARAALRDITNPDAWQPGFLLGARIIPIAHDAMYLMLARLPAGTRIGRHPHAAREVTMVLDGVLLEDGKNRYTEGAVCEMAPGTVHEVEVAGDEDCLVVFAIHHVRNPP
jgi:quercetin dioxygenase-like cupin family protein